MSCKSSAQAFVQSYASAMHTAQEADIITLSCGSALVAYYLPGLTAFVFGEQITHPTKDKWKAIVVQHLERLERSGLGFDVRLVKSRVESVSASSAIYFVTWRILPKNHIDGWEFENVYRYRLGQDGKEGWEFTVSDNEIAGIMQYAPNFYDAA